MMNEGFGESHVNSLLAVLNIPGISRRGLSWPIRTTAIKHSTTILIWEDISIDHPDPFSTPKPFLFFYLEATAFARASTITEIAVVCGNQTFNCYIRPAAEISLEATEVTGLTCVEGIMKGNGTVVESTDPGSGL